MANILAGISFPFRIYGSGLPASAMGTDVIRSALILLLKTNQGARVMRPTLGTKLQRLVFENVGPILSTLIKREILTVVGDELPMVSIINIDLQDENHEISVNIFYLIQGVQDQTGKVMVATRN